MALTQNRSESTAWATVRRLTQPDVEPTLSFDDLFDVINQYRQYTVWTPATSYLAGAVTVPPIPNGWAYRIAREPDGTMGGTSGATEPTWMTRPDWPSIQAKRVLDGTCYWEIHEPARADLWDIDQICYELWQVKLAKASGDYQVSVSGVSFHPEQVIPHIESMLERFRPVRIV